MSNEDEEMRQRYLEARELHQGRLDEIEGEDYHQPELVTMLSDMRQENAKLGSNNQRLSFMLSQAKNKISELADAIDKLSSPPNLYVTFLYMNDDDTAEVISSGRRMRVCIGDDLGNPADLRRGQYLVVNESMVAIGIGPFVEAGEICKVVSVLGDNRLIIDGRMDEERVIYLRDDLLVDDSRPIKAGDKVLVDSTSAVALEYIFSEESQDSLLEEVPDVTFDAIGGVDEAIEMIHDSVELPYKYPELFDNYELSAPKGILLYGPPGCGKTLIAKAIANSLAKNGGTAQFMNVSGPELLTKWVGESERKIRDLFKRAREVASPESPVVIFFDEMESMFRMRGSGRSSDMESTIVPTLLSELDGVEGLDNVLVIGATNRQDLIDPAVLRPGRLDIKIRLGRPDEVATSSILGKYLHDKLPLADSVDIIIEKTVDHIFDQSEDKQFLELQYAKGDREILYFKDFISGAMLENIVSRAKKSAVKRQIANGSAGITHADMLDAVDQEFAEARDLPNTSSPEEWAKVTGRKGDDIVKVRSLVAGEEDSKSKVEDVHLQGQYL